MTWLARKISFRIYESDLCRLHTAITLGDTRWKYATWRAVSLDVTLFSAVVCRNRILFLDIAILLKEGLTVMRKITTVVSLMFAAIIGLAGPAFAQNPHFNRADATGPNNNGSLTVTFRIVGLGSHETITATASADAQVKFACQNNGGNFPAAPNHQEFSRTVSTSGTFTATRSGQVNGTLTIFPPSPTLVCPRGQHIVLVSVSYTNVQISANTSEGTISQGVPGTFARVFFPGVDPPATANTADSDSADAQSDQPSVA